MGNFVVFIPHASHALNAQQHFHTALHYTQHFKSLQPNRVIEHAWGCAASYPRSNGSGNPLVTDDQSSCWLLASGTWLHQDNFHANDETQLLQRYLSVGPVQLAKELDGFFCILIGDARSQQIHVVTDLIGSCHVFARSNTEGLYLSGSSLTLAALGGYDLDDTACQEFLQSGIIYEDRTIYQQVRKLPPSSVIRYTQGKQVQVEKYWQIESCADETYDGQVAVEKLWDALQNTVKRIDRLQARKVCDLTGGYDSRALAAALIGAQVPFSTTVSGPKESMDVIVSHELAELTGIPHQHTLFREPFQFAELKNALAYTDGEYDLADYARILRVHRKLMSAFDISLNGSFCEVARGYWWELLFPRIGAKTPLDADKLARLRFAPGTYDAALIPENRRLEFATHYGTVIRRTNQGLTHTPNTLQMDNTYLTMRMQRWQGRIASSTDQLWPCLSPFIFRPVLETMLKIKPSMRLRSLVVRKMLASYQPTLANARLEHGQPAAPATWKNFYRFSPLANYYGKKIVSKIAQKAGLQKNPSHSIPQPTPLRLQLWQDEEVRALLTPNQMQLNQLFDEVQLASFLRQSQTDHFDYNEQWSRILSLEYALQALHRAPNKN